MQLLNAPRCALVPMEFKFHLYWILAVRLHWSGSHIFDQHILPKIKPATGEKADAHCLFKLTVANDGQMPIKMYTELDLTFLGLEVPKVGILIAEEPNQVLDKKHQTRLPWYNRMESGCPMTCLYRNMAPQDLTHLYVLKEVNPSLFSQLCIFYHSNIWRNNTLGATSEVMSLNIISIKSPKTDYLSKKRLITF